MYQVNGTTIKLIRGDTLELDIDITNYEPTSNDSIRFAMKKEYEDTTVLFQKTISTETLKLRLESTDTKTFAFGTYVYDIQLTKQDGTVDTFITGKLKLLKEVE